MARAVVEVGEGGYARCEARPRTFVAAIESGNEEMMLPLTLEIQMRAMARTLLRGAGACRQRISPAHEAQSWQLSQGATQAARKRGLWARSKAVAETCDWSRYAYGNGRGE